MTKKTIKLLSSMILISISISYDAVSSMIVSYEELNDHLIIFKSSDQQGLIVMSDQHSVLIDPIDEKTAESIKTFLDRNKRPPISTIIYSHSHWDRIQGSNVFEDKKLDIIAQKNCGMYLSGNEHTEISKPNIYFEDNYELIVGEEIIRLHYFGPSHGECMAVMELEKSKLLFIPDLIKTTGPAFPDDPTLPFLRPASLEAFFNSTEKLARSKNIDLFISGHYSEKTFGSINIISQQKSFWKKIELMAIEAEEKGLVDLNNFIAIEKMDLEQIKEYENYNENDLVNILRRYTSYLNMGR